jgi:hypothetical protein
MLPAAHMPPSQQWRVYAVARARWRRRFALSLALRLLARIALLVLAVFFTCGSDLPGIARFLEREPSGGEHQTHGESSRRASDEDGAAVWRRVTAAAGRLANTIPTGAVHYPRARASRIRGAPRAIEPSLIPGRGIGPRSPTAPGRRGFARTCAAASPQGTPLMCVGRSRRARSRRPPGEHEPGPGEGAPEDPAGS